MNKRQALRVVDELEEQGWQLLRITGSQHFLFTGKGDVQLVLNLHGQHAVDRYTRRHLRRDCRRLAKASAA